MTVEVVLYVLFAGLLSALRRVISGAKNGCFYAKDSSSSYPALLKKYILNIHYLETPAWYSQFGSQFLLCLATYRVLHIQSDDCGYITPFIGALLTTMGCSAIAGVFYQGYINVSKDKDFIDLTENSYSEFALGNIHFWWYRPWYGKKRIYASILGIITFAFGIYLGFN